MPAADVRWIWLSHPDRDHTGGLFALPDAAPEAKGSDCFGAPAPSAESADSGAAAAFAAEELQALEQMLAGFEPAGSAPAGQ
ncbi:hypothetical protein ABZZ20_25285 [Streptomyces sp. NPDC006430]|uniref:hypothetical protein n=1 Tax=Streptomyces sp. NPDC006430 TaxID=3154299 RepID=UPI0033B07933